jgi:1-aminocyclopropane-1-carboxylate deaminase
MNLQTQNYITKMLPYQTTPVIQLNAELLSDKEITLSIKREDLNHPHAGGNKWWKLKYNLEEALRSDKRTIITFGGAYSNHIYATAAACHSLGLQSVGVIRGDEANPLNATLLFARDSGMHLHFVSRDEYKKKTGSEFQQSLKERFGDHYLIPEGGTNMLALKGCAEFAETQLMQIEFDYLVVPVGTGGTIAGLISGLKSDRKVIGVSALKSGDFLIPEINDLIHSYSGRRHENWELWTQYHHGGYAKVTKGLIAFVKHMEFTHKIPWDPVYTGKMMWAILKEISHDAFPRGSKILAIHTGGLQGARSLIK